VGSQDPEGTPASRWAAWRSPSRLAVAIGIVSILAWLGVCVWMVRDFANPPDRSRSNPASQSESGQPTTPDTIPSARVYDTVDPSVREVFDANSRARLEPFATSPPPTSENQSRTPSTNTAPVLPADPPAGNATPAAVIPDPRTTEPTTTTEATTTTQPSTTTTTEPPSTKQPKTTTSSSSITTRAPKKPPPPTEPATTAESTTTTRSQRGPGGGLIDITING